MTGVQTCALPICVTEKETIPVLPPDEYTVTFMNGETEVASVSVAENTAIGEKLPAGPDKGAAYVFEGWFDENNKAVNAETVVTGPLTANARYSYLPEGSGAASAGAVTVYATWAPGVFPEGTTLHVEDAGKDKALSMAESAGLNAIDGEAVDITFINNGTAIQPAAGKSVSISLSLSRSLEGDSFTVLHEKAAAPQRRMLMAKAAPASNVETVAVGASANSASFAGSSFSVYAIVGDASANPQDIPTNTFVFLADGTTVREVILKDGETLDQPANPEKSGYRFSCWCEDEACTTPFTGFGPVSVTSTVTTELYAKFDRIFYVRYVDGSGNVIRTDEVAEGDSCTIDKDAPVFTVQDGQYNAAWTDGSAEYGRSGAQSVTPTASMTLSPVLVSGWLVKYHTNGGSQLPNEYVAPNAQLTRPTDPTRAGYLLENWCTDEGLNTPYNFSEPVTGNLELYAKWDPQQVNFTVAVWTEVANHPENPTDQEKYVFHGGFQMQALAGSDVTLSAALQNQATQKVTQEGGYLPYVYESDKSTNANAGLTIAGDESTVVNVYFRLKTVKLYLADRVDRGAYPENYTPQNYGAVPRSWIVLNPNAPLILRYGQSYDFAGAYPNYGEWPSQWTYLPNGIKVEQAKRTFAEGYYSSCITAGVSNFPDASAIYYMAYDALGDYTFRRVTYREMIASALTENGYTSKGNYFNSADLVIPNKASSLGAIQNRVEPFETLHNMTTGYYSFQETGGPYPNYYRYNAHLYKGQLYTEHQVIDEYGDSNVLKFYERRCKYPLVLQKGVGPDPVQAELAGIPYEMNIADYLDWYETQNGVEGLRFTNNDGDPEVYEPGVSTYVRDEIPYLFVGWYDNEAYAGSTVDFADRTMPQGGLTVYAKWVPQQFEVTFDVNGGTWTDSAQTQQTVDYGSQVAEPSEPTPPTGAMFLGWTLNGKAYSFASPVTANITLVAHYASDEAYHVLYDAGEGSGTVTDSLIYLPDSTAVAKNSDGLTPPPGKRFDHWVDEDGNAYLPGDLVNVVDADVTLTAIYVPDLPMTALVYDRNYSHFSISPAPTSPEEDVTSLPSAANNSKVDLRGITAASSANRRSTS